MKIRTDFVTNSSSSSFILARRGELTEEQKEVIVKYVEEIFLGEAMTQESIAQEIKARFEEQGLSRKYQKRVKEELKDGKSIYWGRVSFDCPAYSLAELYLDLWDKLQKIGDDNFEIIAGNLSH